FLDPKLEGAFADSGWDAPDGRAKIDDYIQEQIRTYSSIIRYYKNRHNALTPTCRIPSEVLACIFRQVACDAAAGVDTNTYSLHWIKSISHICSHWREVALSTPTLWSTIDVDHSPTWAFEMLRRSRDAPLALLTTRKKEVISRRAYPVLLQALTLHLPRIYNLMMGSTMASSLALGAISRVEHNALLQLLAQHDCPELKCLELSFAGIVPESGQAELQLPDRVITRSAALKHLALRGYGINWGLSPAFEGLKSFDISDIPRMFEPTMAQLLRFLSRLPFLETLSVANLDLPQEALPLHHVERIHMKYLKHLSFKNHSLSTADTFFDCLTFDSLITVYFLWFNPLSSDLLPVPTSLKKLIQQLDDATNGPVLELAFQGSSRIACWKSKQRWLEKLPPTILLDFEHDTFLKNDVIRPLRLDQLEFLKVDSDRSEERLWSFVGDLPKLEELEVFRSEEAVLTALSYNLPLSPGIQAVRLAFPALTRLTIVAWRFNHWSSTIYEAIGWTLLRCLQLRHEANLSLRMLKVQNCNSSYFEHGDRSQFEQIIHEVDWNARR
ncbi:hypothetical protein H0H92_012481, partial [Tricholoma furcatifolium]